MGDIEIRKLTKDYGRGRGVFDLSFTVEEGEAFGFLGPNGAGKTTALRHVMGFLTPDSGSCSVGGLDCRRDAARIQKYLGYIPGEMSLIDEMSGLEFLRFYAAYRGMDGLGRANELLEMFELDPRARIRRMSKGMKQKVGIVAAFMHDPRVLVLDEPTSGLDPLMQNRFIELILQEKKRGRTILISSHIFEEVERTCSRVGIIRAGRLVAIDEIDALRRSQIRKYLIEFRDAESAKKFLEEPLDTELMSDGRVAVRVREDLNTLISALQRYPVADLETGDRSLEEIFMHYYGGGDIGDKRAL
ncbi:MAG: ABC transporter ATP-binding protein [Oscillospiraceae bacterium]|jgi:ABC-2 type transport system ATP-binding protein